MQHGAGPQMKGNGEMIQVRSKGKDGLCDMQDDLRFLTKGHLYILR